jgi:hypothetical protein
MSLGRLKRIGEGRLTGNVHHTILVAVDAGTFMAIRDRIGGPGGSPGSGGRRVKTTERPPAGGPNAHL